MKKLFFVGVLAAGSAIGLLAADYLSATDHLFAKSAAQAGLAQVKLGQLAVSQGSSQKVKNLGQRMVNAEKTMDSLKAIAAKDNILLPSTLSAKDQTAINRLSSLSGPVFDRAYVESLVKERETTLGLFQNEGSVGSNSDLKGFASSTLLILQEQLEQARQAAGSVAVPAAK